MKADVEELRKQFASKLPALSKSLKDWYDEETAAIDGSIVSAAPSGSGGSIISARPAIDSKRVVDATLITEEVLDIELPPEIIKAGGYETYEAMLDHIVPLLEKVFTGELTVKKRKRVKEPETV
ncbi:hypothetical protein MKK69_08195 [Methylobacterium sp. J-026]|uniref:hypothetical protein n=1 Tax=Methylobacterium sp. J-026 TaxID=2836624 RepID=UPI001FBA6CC7|nr:hypothetical protein [Methylobacterium sp. J-026]MCJ2134046.1 hypothetical protein [Methylobacterium sp. J-026]